MQSIHLVRQLQWGSSVRARRDCQTAAFGSFLPKLLMQGQTANTVQTVKRSEVPLQSSTPNKHPFRVCTFNVLADGLAQTGDFVKVPISCLQWEHRLPLILQEVRAADADIICLQELNHFDVLAAALVPEGYSCFFRAKKPSPAVKFGFPADGIALFYRHSRFSCNPAPAGHCFASIDGQPAAQGFVTALLYDKLSAKHVVVAVTHLKAKAGVDNEQTRVHQVQQLLQEVEHMQERHMQLQLQQQQQQLLEQVDTNSGNGAAGRSAAEPAAVLLCGDFNTTPDSDTVRAIKQHELGLHSIWDVPWAVGKMHSSSSSNGKHSSNGKSSSAGLVKPTNGSSSVNSSSGTQLSEAQAAVPPSNGNGHKHQQAAAAGASADADDAVGPANTIPAQEGCEFTTWKFRSSGAAKRTIDYVWYSASQLVPVSRWRMLSEAEIGPAGLPNTQYPSDHMAVTCQFGWADE